MNRDHWAGMDSIGHEWQNSYYRFWLCLQAIFAEGGGGNRDGYQHLVWRALYPYQ